MRLYIEALVRWYRDAPAGTRFALIGLLLSAVWAGVAFGYQHLGPALDALRP
jgi:hypothetical protein